MRHNLNTLAMLALAALTLTMTSCQKEDPIVGKPSESTKAVQTLSFSQNAITIFDKGSYEVAVSYSNGGIQRYDGLESSSSDYGWTIEVPSETSSVFDVKANENSISIVPNSSIDSSHNGEYKVYGLVDGEKKAELTLTLALEASSKALIFKAQNIILSDNKEQAFEVEYYEDGVKVPMCYGAKWDIEMPKSAKGFDTISTSDVLNVSVEDGEKTTKIKINAKCDGVDNGTYYFYGVVDGQRVATFKVVIDFSLVDLYFTPLAAEITDHSAHSFGIGGYLLNMDAYNANVLNEKKVNPRETCGFNLTWKVEMPENTARLFRCTVSERGELIVAAENNATSADNGQYYIYGCDIAGKRLARFTINLNL